MVLPPPTPTPTLIRHARVPAPDVDAGVLVDILVSAGRIAAIGAAGGLVADASAQDLTVLDASDCLVLPGLVNGHTHAHGGLARGAVPDRVNLETFLAWSAALHGERSLADLQLSAQLSAVEQLRKGCTACFDMALELPAPTVAGLHAVGTAYAQVGLRAVVAPMLADRTLFEAYPEMRASLPPALQARVRGWRLPDATQLLAVWREAQHHWPFDRQQVQLGLAPTIPLHCSDELLRGCAALSAEFDTPLQTHLAETKLQALLGRAQQGEGPVQRLARTGCLGPRTSVAHAVWLDDADRALLARHGVTAVHNPLSNLRLGSGLAAVRELLDAGVNVAVGSDGTHTSDGQNLFEAMRMAAYLSRLCSADMARWLDAGAAWHMGSVAGSRVLGRAGEFGQLAPGQWADLIFIDLRQSHYVPLRHLLRQFVYAESGQGLVRVMVAGRLVLDQGRVLGVDEAALRVQAEQAARRLDAATEQARALATLMTPSLAACCCEANGLPFAIARRLAD